MFVCACANLVPSILMELGAKVMKAAWEPSRKRTMQFMTQLVNQGGRWNDMAKVARHQCRQVDGRNLIPIDTHGHVIK